MKSTIVVFWFQGKPRVLLDEELEDPYTFNSIEDAVDWIKAGDHIMLESSDSVVAVDVATGECEQW